MKVLMVVDAQRDFMPGGSLAVPNGDQIVSFINQIKSRYDLVVWTKDWHPKDHCSFKENGGIWPVHCVKENIGSHLHRDLKVSSGDIVVTKGQRTAFDSYSAFKDDGGERTEICKLLKKRGVDSLDICGLATEYCLKFTVLDALQFGFKVNVLIHGCRGISDDEVAKAIKEMRGAGAKVFEEVCTL